jgi:hypothetical protein
MITPKTIIESKESEEIDSEFQLEEQYFQSGMASKDAYDYEELEKASEAKKQEEDHPELGSFLDNIEFIHDAIDNGNKNKITTCQCFKNKDKIKLLYTLS